MDLIKLVDLIKEVEQLQAVSQGALIDVVVVKLVPDHFQG